MAVKALAAGPGNKISCRPAAASGQGHSGFPGKPLLEPFGMGNRRPVFFSTALPLAGRPVVMGKKKNHLKLRVGEAGDTRECVGWDMARRIEELETGRIDIVYQLKADEWRDRRRVQMMLKDFRSSMTVK